MILGLLYVLPVKWKILYTILLLILYLNQKMAIQLLGQIGIIL